MIEFWLLATAMVLVVLALVVPAMLASGSGPGVGRDRLNIAVFRDHLTELEADRAEGTLTAEQYAAARVEMQRELLDEVDDGPGAAQGAVRGRAAAWFVLLFVPLFSVVIYLQLGQSHLLTDQGLASLQTPQREQGHAPAEVEAMLTQLAERLAQEPDNLEGWTMLGRSLLATQRFEDAVRAFAQAYRLAGNDPDVVADYAEALAMRQGGQMLGEPLELAERVLGTVPNHPKALWLAGIGAYQTGRLDDALERWGRLRSMLDANDPNRAQLDEFMARAEADGGRAPAGSAAPPAGGDIAAAEDASIAVTVRLDPALAGRVAAGDTLFVFARAAQGPRLPLAIVRRTAGELPLTVTLDDSQAMAPNFRLSGFSEVEVGARVSKSGDAIPQPGDLQGRVAGVLVGADRAVEVLLAEEVADAATPPATEAAAGAAPTPPPVAAAGAVEVEVRLDPTLQSRIAPGDTLFVFARAAQGPRLPLAIVRRTAGELPLTVTLDDSQAMAPNFRLSGFSEVEVGARVSKSGNATPQPGDLQGRIDGVRLGSRVQLTISEAL